MNFDLVKPCAKCPFRTDCLKGWLGESRAAEITDSIVNQQQYFPCHETTRFDYDGNSTNVASEQHCAGAMILLEKINMPNQMMRIAERLRMYDRTRLDMEAPVFSTPGQFVRHHKKSKSKKSAR